jgi:hypothetical protein
VVGDAGTGSPNRLLYIAGDAPPPPSSEQKIAIPAYFYPGETPGSKHWTLLEKSGSTVGMVIINPEDGVGAQIDQNYVTQIKRLRNLGIKPVGYVMTAYGARAFAAVQAEIHQYRTWYGITDIMLDQATYDGCGKVNYYRDLYNHIRANSSDATVIISPGTNFPECMMQIGNDVIAVTFEDTYATYKKWQPESWMANYPAERFWHIISTTTAKNLPAAVNRAKQNQAGWVYVTSDKGKNPWDTLPPSSYWQKELTLVQSAAVSAGELADATSADEIESDANAVDEPQEEEWNE